MPYEPQPQRSREAQANRILWWMLGVLILVVGSLVSGWISARLQAEDRLSERQMRIETRVSDMDKQYGTALGTINTKLDMLIEQSHQRSPK